MGNPLRIHLYDFERTALDGCRVLCGRYSVSVKWVGRPEETRATLCTRCLERWHERNDKKDEVK